ncbi:MAG: DUF104 domain-containing protein [Chloroflexi bacterium]|nr:DUF104 domain-containing protein [Chloroflexota bacterium]
MAKEIRARYTNGVLEPLEELELEEGREVIISIEEVISPDEALKAFRRALGAWKGTHDPEELKRKIYEDRLIHTRPEPRL